MRVPAFVDQVLSEDRCGAGEGVRHVNVRKNISEEGTVEANGRDNRRGWHGGT